MGEVSKPRAVLLLTYAFPPMVMPEAALAVKCMGNINRAVDVVCAHPFRAWMGDDHSLDQYIDDNFRSVTRIAPPGMLARLPLGRFGPLARVPDTWRILNRRTVAAVLARNPGQYAAMVDALAVPLCSPCRAPFAATTRARAAVDRALQRSMGL